MPILQLPALRSGLLATAPRTRRGMWVDPPAAPTNRMWRVANRRPLQPIDKRSPEAVSSATRCCGLLQKPQRFVLTLSLLLARRIRVRVIGPGARLDALRRLVSLRSLELPALPRLPTDRRICLILELGRLGCEGSSGEPGEPCRARSPSSLERVTLSLCGSQFSLIL